MYLKELEKGFTYKNYKHNIFHLKFELLFTFLLQGKFRQFMTFRKTFLCFAIFFA